MNSLPYEPPGYFILPPSGTVIAYHALSLFLSPKKQTEKKRKTLPFFRVRWIIQHFWLIILWLHKQKTFHQINTETAYSFFKEAPSSRGSRSHCSCAIHSHNLRNGWIFQIFLLSVWSVAFQPPDCWFHKTLACRLLPSHSRARDKAFHSCHWQFSNVVTSLPCHCLSNFLTTPF